MEPRTPISKYAIDYIRVSAGFAFPVSVPPPRFAVIAAYARLLGWRSAGLTCMVNKDVLDECSERMGADGEDLCALTDRCAAAMERAPTAIWATADAQARSMGARRGLSRLGATA